MAWFACLSFYTPLKARRQEQPCFLRPGYFIRTVCTQEPVLPKSSETMTPFLPAT